MLLKSSIVLGYIVLGTLLRLSYNYTFEYKNNFFPWRFQSIIYVPEFIRRTSFVELFFENSYRLCKKAHSKMFGCVLNTHFLARIPYLGATNLWKPRTRVWKSHSSFFGVDTRHEGNLENMIQTRSQEKEGKLEHVIKTRFQEIKTFDNCSAWIAGDEMTLVNSWWDGSREGWDGSKFTGCYKKESTSTQSPFLWFY